MINLDLVYLINNLVKEFEKEKDIKFIEENKRIITFKNNKEVFIIGENGVIKSINGCQRKLFFDLFDVVSKTRAENI